MVTLTTSYQMLAQTYVGNTGHSDVYLRLYAKYNSQSIKDNTSSVSYKSTIYFGTGTFYTGNTTTKILEGSGATTVSQDGAATYYAGETTLNEISGTVWHNAEGKYTAWGKATFISTPWGWNTVAEATADLPTIPRYATSNQSLNSKTETTIKMNWSSDNTIDYLWYSINNGSSWTGVDVTDGTSGTYTISGLTANTTYTIKTRVRRKDSQLTTDSSALSITTYKVPSNSLNARTETTIKMSWSVDSTADYIWYSTDNGSNWTAVGSVSAISGSYTISGLSANTTYKVKTRVRRKATQTTYDCSAVSVTTYDFPYCIETPNFTIGSAGVTFKFYNPLGRTFTFNVIANGVQLEYTWTQSGGTSHLCFDGESTQAQLYATIPKQQSSTYQVKVTYDSSVKIRNNGNTFKIDPNLCKPTFTNFTYADIDSTVITENNQILVDKNSDCKFTISTANKAIAKNSATMISYKCEWGNLSKTVNYSSGSEVTATVVGSTGGTLKVTAIDSRGLSTTVTKTVPYIAYTNAVVNNVEVQRLNGVNLETYLGLKMNIWRGNWRNGSNTAYDNQLKYVGYRVFDGSNWTSYFDITDSIKAAMSTSTSGSSKVITVSLNKKIAIHADGSSGGFAIGKEYTIQVLIKDGTSTAIFTPYSYQATKQGVVPNGIVGLSRYKDSDGDYHYGINRMPDDNFALAIEGTGKMTSITIEDIDCKNIFNKYKALIGQEINGADGSTISNTNNFTSNYMRVEPNTIYFISGKTAGTSNCFYDKDKNFISTIKMVNGAITTPNNENVYYMRFNGTLKEIDTTQLEKNKAQTPYTECKSFCNEEIYSTLEQKIGIWLDGSIVYKKTVVWTPSDIIGEKGATILQYIAHNISNFKQLIDIRTTNSTNNTIPSIGGDTGAEYGTCIYQVNGTDIIMRIVNDTWGVRTWYFTLKYTKQ